MEIIQNFGLALLILTIICAVAQAQQEEKSYVLPEHDPAPKKWVQLAEKVRGVHPRLLFTPEDIPKLKEFAQGDGKEFLAPGECPVLGEKWIWIQFWCGICLVRSPGPDARNLPEICGVFRCAGICCGSCSFNVLQGIIG